MTEEFHQQFIALMEMYGATSDEVESLLENFSFTHGELIDLVNNDNDIKDVCELSAFGFTKAELIRASNRVALNDLVELIDAGFDKQELEDILKRDPELIELLAGFVRNGHSYDAIQALIRNFRSMGGAVSSTGEQVETDLKRFIHRLKKSLGSTLDDFNDGWF